MSKNLTGILICFALVGCASQADKVVLLPQEGRSTAVVVSNTAGKSATLSEPYAEAQVSTDDIQLSQRDIEMINQHYSAVLAATPMQPKRYVLYFVSGSTELTTESALALPGIISDAATFPGGEAVIIGHTDSVGPLESNDALSLSRAQLMRDYLVKAGMPEEKVKVAGRGERELVVNTADNVDEPRNRRVEVKLR